MKQERRFLKLRGWYESDPQELSEYRSSDIPKAMMTAALRYTSRVPLLLASAHAYINIRFLCRPDQSMR
jgi:hypothetical protein